MTSGLAREDLQDSEKVLDLLEKARIQAFGSACEQARLIMSEREACSRRGYHRVESEPKTGDDLMICYDCELWFDRDIAEQTGLKYRAENP